MAPRKPILLTVNLKNRLILGTQRRERTGAELMVQRSRESGKTGREVRIWTETWGTTRTSIKGEMGDGCVWKEQDMPVEGTRMNLGVRKCSGGCDYRGTDWKERMEGQLSTKLQWALNVLVNISFLVLRDVQLLNNCWAVIPNQKSRRIQFQGILSFLKSS